MADKEISAIADAASLTGSELIHLIQGGNSRKTTAQDIANLGGGSGGGSSAQVFEGWSYDLEGGSVINLVGATSTPYSCTEEVFNTPGGSEWNSVTAVYTVPSSLDGKYIVVGAEIGLTTGYEAGALVFVTYTPNGGSATTVAITDHNDAQRFQCWSRPILVSTGDTFEYTVRTGTASTIDNDTRSFIAGYVIGTAAPASTTKIADWVQEGTIEEAVIVSQGAAAAFDESIREIGNVLYDPDDTTHPYKLVYTGYPGAYDGNDTAIGWASSTDGITWIKQGELTGITRASEDPYLVKDGSTYYIYVEDKDDVPFRDIRCWTSTDFSTWVDEGEVLGPTVSEWDEDDVSSPVVWIEGSTWYMLYEGRTSGGVQRGAVGLATSADGLVWTKEASNPVLAGVNPGEGFDGAIQWTDSIIPDDIRMVEGKYVLGFHALFARHRGYAVDADDEIELVSLGMAVSDDLLTWKDALGQPWSDSGSPNNHMQFHEVGGTPYVIQQDLVEDITMGPIGSTRPVVCEVYRTANQASFPTNSYAIVEYASQNIDSFNGFNFTTNKWEVPYSGFYTIETRTRMDLSATGRIASRVMVEDSGATYTQDVQSYLIDNENTAATIIQDGHIMLFLKAGELVSHEAYVQGGVDGGNLGHSKMTIRKV